MGCHWHWPLPQCENRIETVAKKAKKSRWWFQILFIFTPTWGNDPIWLYNIFQMGWNHQPRIYEGFDLWCNLKCFLQGPSRFSWSFPFPVHSSDHDVWYLSSAALTIPPQFFRLSIDHQLLGNRPRHIPNLNSWTLKTSSLSNTQIGLPL